MIILWAIGLLLFASFLLIVFRGAPFVPTRVQDIDELFKLHDFKKDEILIDLGSGDGRVLIEAAKRGLKSVGYELNPFLMVYSWFRVRKLPHTTVRLEDFWRAKLPVNTAVVFVFLAGPFMNKLDRKLQNEATRLGHSIELISYGMQVPKKLEATKRGAFVVYSYEPQTLSPIKPS